MQEKDFSKEIKELGDKIDSIVNYLKNDDTLLDKILEKYIFPKKQKSIKKILGDLDGYNKKQQELEAILENLPKTIRKLIDSKFKEYDNHLNKILEGKIDDLFTIAPLAFAKRFLQLYIPLYIGSAIIIFVIVLFFFPQLRDLSWVIALLLLGLGYGLMAAFNHVSKFIKTNIDRDKFLKTAQEQIKEIDKSGDKEHIKMQIEVFKAYLRDTAEYLKEDPKD